MVKVEVVDETKTETQRLKDKVADWILEHRNDSLPTQALELEVINPDDLTAILGISSINPFAPAGKIAGIIPRKPARYHFGIIFFERLGTGDMYAFTDGASEAHWVFTVNGRQFLDMAVWLAEKMQTDFKVTVTVVLKSEDPVVAQTNNTFSLSDL